MYSSLNVLWHCPSLVLEWKLTFSSSVVIAEFFKFADILSAALSQHHLLGFEIAQLKFQYFGHLMRRVDSLEKTDAGRDWGQEEKGMTEDEMARWHH